MTRGAEGAGSDEVKGMWCFCFIVCSYVLRVSGNTNKEAPHSPDLITLHIAKR